MEQMRLEGINKTAFRMVINHCPPSTHVELELRLTKLVATALLVGIDRDWLALQLGDASEEAISKRLKQSIH